MGIFTYLRLMRYLALSTIFFVSSMLVTSKVHAQSFGVLNCPSVPGFQEIDFPLPDTSHLRSNTGIGLMNNVNDEKYVYSSLNVKRISLLFSNFQMETNYDFLEFGEKDSTIPLILTGTLFANTWLPPIYASVDFNQIPGSLRVKTDQSIASVGYNITKARVTCGPSQTPGTVFPQLNLGKFHLGILLGTNDSIFFQIPVVSGQNTNLLLAGTNNTDFDLYARCNAVPTKTVFTAASGSGDSNEFLSLPSSSCPNGIWNVVVHSYIGAGGFTLLPSRSFQSENLVLRAYVQSNSNAEVDSTATTLALAARRIYSTTMGAMRPLEIQVCGGFNYSSCGIFNITKRYDCSRSFADGIRAANGPIQGIALCSDGNANTVVHEIGHAVLGLPDEYQDVGNPPVSISRCGHTVMGANWIPSLCYSGDHNKDFPAGSSPTGIANSNWNTHPNVFMPSSMIPSKTPSVIDLSNHDFNNSIIVGRHYSP